jgi:dihydropteroate synthase
VSRWAPAVPLGLAPAATRPLILGVVNVTPNSFSDGGRYLDAAAAIAHGEALVAAGADWLDVGGEATNPRAAPVSAAEETDRVVPVIEGLAARGFVVAVDTTKAAVARAALAAGASIVNDISAGRFDPGMFAAAAGAGAYIAGHLRGDSIADVFAREAAAPPSWDEVVAELGARLVAMPADLAAKTLVDPGVGFGKGADPSTNLALCRRAGDLARALGRPVVVGPSRKRFLRRLVGEARGADAPADLELTLDAATVGACLAAVSSGVNVLRVHNVALLRPALIVYTEE